VRAHTCLGSISESPSADKSSTMQSHNSTQSEQSPRKVAVPSNRPSTSGKQARSPQSPARRTNMSANSLAKNRISLGGKSQNMCKRKLQKRLIIELDV
jgi:hypothetical protein